ncbi:hypothetical protein ACFV5N_09310 [Streptomyces sp. NPDC059853]|uniref:hypothetical protein n=1 Tax=Streptomyces sp. NPDC059853 TaxID=3346973 RepID=UPI003657A8AE
MTAVSTPATGATGLSPGQVAELRERARHEAGPFVDPHLAQRIRVHNAEWASAILGHPFPGQHRITWPELYLLHIAAEAEPSPPPPPATAAAARHRAEQETARAAVEQAYRQQVEEWEQLAAGLGRLGVRAEVRHNYTSHRHLGHYTQGGDHIYLLDDLHIGRLRRLAGRVLCFTRSRARNLREFPEPARDGRPPTCRACLTTARRITTRGAVT